MAEECNEVGIKILFVCHPCGLLGLWLSAALTHGHSSTCVIPLTWCIRVSLGELLLYQPVQALVHFSHTFMCAMVVTPYGGSGELLLSALILIGLGLSAMCLCVT